MMKVFISILSILVLFIFQQNNEIFFSGEQIKLKADTNNQLICKSLKIEKAVKVIKVEGDCNGYWIQKDNITVHKFSKPEKSIGLVLKPGKYTVYPELKPKQKKAKITLTLKYIK